MGLNFNTLVQAALGGSAAYSQGKRTGRLEKEEREARRLAAEDAARYRASQIAENEEQAADRKYRRENPEEFRVPRQISEHEARTTWIDAQVAQGQMTPSQAAQAANERFGKNEPRDQGPVRGSAEWMKTETDLITFRNKSEAQYRRPLQGRSTGEGGSAKEAIDRREFFQKRIPYYTDKGYNGAEAQAAAEREYRGAQYSANAVTRPATAATLGRSIPGSGSFNAGTRGVRPTETSSTQRSDPRNPNSPKVGTLKEATPDDVRRAVAAIGRDKARKNPAAVEKWLSDRGFAP